MLQLTTSTASGGPFLQWPMPSMPVFTVEKVAGGPPAAAKADGSSASASAKATNVAESLFIPNTCSLPSSTVLTYPATHHRRAGPRGPTSATKPKWTVGRRIGTRTRYVVGRRAPRIEVLPLTFASRHRPLGSPHSPTPRVIKTDDAAVTPMVRRESRHTSRYTAPVTRK